MRLVELRRKIEHLRGAARNPKEIEKLNQIMEQIQRLERDCESLEGLKKSPRKAGYR
jgi:hypothetical protein